MLLPQRAAPYSFLAETLTIIADAVALLSRITRLPHVSAYLVF